MTATSSRIDPSPTPSGAVGGCRPTGPGRDYAAKLEQRKGIRGRNPEAWAWAIRAGHLALALWFAYFAWRGISGIFMDWPAHLDTVGIDGRLYYRAAATFLAGGDPWTATTAQTFTNTWPPSGGHIPFNFTGPPPTVLAFVPFVWIPEWIFVALWFAVSAAAAVYTIRRLRLPLYWLLFPPLVQGISVGNPHIVCLALLLCGSNWLRALAAPMKAYAVIPMVTERQWRALAFLGGPDWLRLCCSRHSGRSTSRTTARSMTGSSARLMAGSLPLAILGYS